MIKLLYLIQATALLLATTIASPVDLRLANRDLLPKPIPSFVLEFAPLSHLLSNESWFPSDIAVHLTHVVPQINFTNTSTSVTFQTIGALPSDVFLTSKDPVEDQPSWMLSPENKPDARGLSRGAPATIICVEKPGDILDAFFFQFYSFNQGSTLLGLPMDHHVGDWEHLMVRFVHNKPAFIYLSAHTGGFAFNYSALPTINNRATTFIAGGTHANYPTVGPHPHGTMNLLSDTTDAGPIWDYTLNFRGFWFDNSTGRFSFAEGRGLGAVEEVGTFGREGLGWLQFEGMWGDEQYPIGEHGQFCIETSCEFTNGPTGPIGKNLGRVAVCEDETDCPVLSTIS